MYHTTPFRIVKRLSDVNFVLENTQTKERKVCHHDQNTRFVEREGRHGDRERNPPRNLEDYITYRVFHAKEPIKKR